MRIRWLRIVCCGVLGLASATSALAGSIVTETFDYPYYGSLSSPQVGGANWEFYPYGPQTPDFHVNSLGALGLMTNFQSQSHREFPARSYLDRTFMCFKLTIVNPGPGILRTAWVAGFSSADSVLDQFVRANVWTVAKGSTFTLGISCQNAYTPNAIWPTALSYDTPYNVTIAYDAAQGYADLWINANSEGDEKIRDTGPNMAQLRSVVLHQNWDLGQAGAIGYTFYIDDISVGTSFADACGTAPVPTRSATWGRIKTIYR